uniref:Uncharacterized protein n=1 Tax=Panagrolaimus sp. ES5 TaxID=591445 RepID=A0AC34FPQ5_9BILA
MARRVRFNDELDYSNSGHQRRQFPTPRPKILLDISSSDEESLPLPPHPDLPVRRRRVRRQNTGKKSGDSSGSSSDTSRRRGHIANTRKDGRRSDKERKRRSALAKSLPRGLDGKFVSRYDTTTPRLSSTPQYSSTPGYSSAPYSSSTPGYSYDQEPAMKTPKRQQKQSKNDESSMDTSMPKMPGGKFVKEIFQTPEFQKAMKAATGQQQSDDESFLDTSYPTLPEGKLIKQIFQTPGFKKLLRAAVAEAVTSGGKKPLNFDDIEDEAKKAPRRRRSSSRSQK